MCTKPTNAAQALAMARTGLSFLAAGTAAELPTETQAEVLTGLEAVEAQLTAARARALAAFSAAHGYEADGQFGARAWLRAFTRVTKGAAAGAMAWMRRLEAHPAVVVALAGAVISASWAREICCWTDRLPPGLIEDADQILLTAVAAGADLHDLALLAAEMIARAAVPDQDEDGFADRALWLDKTLAGAGHLTGDLTPACAAAVSEVLDALSGKAGPEDTRSLTQRRHDALEEACQRLIAANVLPGRAGQPLHVYAHMDLAGLASQFTVGAAGSAAVTARAGVAGGSMLEGRWSLARASAGPGEWCLSGPEAEAAACDATIIPVVVGHLDWCLAGDLITLALPALALAHDQAAPPGPSAASGSRSSGSGSGRLANLPGDAVAAGPDGLINPAILQRLRDLAAEHAIALLSGPAGLAAHLRREEPELPLGGRSQPLDVGLPTPVIPPALRRAVALRDRHCRFPGCRQRPAVCQIHHLKRRADGGLTVLANLGLLCRFHHLIAVHRWGWELTLHPDGTATATSSDGRILHDHSPPSRAA